MIPTHGLRASRGGFRPDKKQDADERTGCRRRRGGSAVAVPDPGVVRREREHASSGIARGTGADWFGPLNPLTPIAPADVAGRRFDFPPGYNLVTRPRGYEPIGFHELRAFADAYDLLRLVIETRKDQMERQRWRIRPRSAKSERRGAGADADLDARIAAIEKFLSEARRRDALEDLAARAARRHVRHRRGDALLPAHPRGPALRACSSSTAPPSSG